MSIPTRAEVEALIAWAAQVVEQGSDDRNEWAYFYSKVAQQTAQVGRAYLAALDREAEAVAKARAEERKRCVTVIEEAIDDLRDDEDESESIKQENVQIRAALFSIVKQLRALPDDSGEKGEHK